MPGEERSGAGLSVAGWTGRVDSRRVDRNCLLSCQRRGERAGEREPGEPLEAWVLAVWDALRVRSEPAFAALAEHVRSEELFRDRGADRAAGSLYRYCD